MSPMAHPLRRCLPTLQTLRNESHLRIYTATEFCRIKNDERSWVSRADVILGAAVLSMRGGGRSFNSDERPAP